MTRGKGRAGGGPVRQPWADDRGAIGGWEVLPLAVLVLLVGALVVANAWGVIDAKAAATAAAREGAQAFARAPSAEAAAERAVTAAEETIAAHRRGDARQREVRVDGAFRRCAEAEVTVEVDVPTIRVPWIGGLAGELTVGATHRQVVDPLRSGVPGDVEGEDVVCGAG